LMIISRFITFPNRVCSPAFRRRLDCRAGPPEGGTTNSKTGGPVAFSILKNKLSDWQSDEPVSNRHHNL
ncbi:MAG TPA: hypothetical protein VF899_20360, partial [Pyrinomonadaceae bacterium]